MFAPDEPDYVSSSQYVAKQSFGRNGKDYENDYLEDRPAACPQPQIGEEGQEEIVEQQCTRWRLVWKNRRKKWLGKKRVCRNWEEVVVQEEREEIPAIDAWLSTEKAQAQTCKYTNASRHRSSFDMWHGPNFYCTTTAVTPLTNDINQLINRIGAMTATGYTNITSGLMWGWRVLSPGAPFTESATTANSNTQQIVILLTDGRNEILGRDNHNSSNYYAWGFSAKNRLGTTSNSSNALNAAMNTKLQQACNNIENQTDIWVFTVGYRLNDATTQGLLNNCAGAAANNRAYQAGSGDLNATFQQIAEQISELRIAE